MRQFLKQAIVPSPAIKNTRASINKACLCLGLRQRPLHLYAMAHAITSKSQIKSLSLKLACLLLFIATLARLCLECRSREPANLSAAGNVSAAENYNEPWHCHLLTGQK
jgi:hypothetical protein